MARPSLEEEATPLEDEPLWYKDAVIYEVHVRAFADSDGDGIGDFRGLTAKLDYLRDLGVTAIWLLPFYPSPLRDDGYDIADYRDVHPDYGTLEDFQRFLEEAHRRGLRVITELVINHTSDQHPWFQRARRAPPGSPERAWYVWSDSPERYGDARIIFKDFERSNWAWDPEAEAYYWHRFYGHQPDLNFDNPAVREAILEVLDFWLDMGVDGLRLDAIPYLFEREGTDCENLPETHAFLRDLRAHVDRKYANRMLLAEANQWPEDVVAYFGKGDESHMAFHFPLMPRLFMALRQEDRYPVLEILQQTPPVPDTCQWALFLRNHDELTLEMVTDEERDYMYRVYAQDPRARINLGIRHRLAPLLQNDRRKIELMVRLLLSLPGTPVLYYGDEIGMGDNIYLGDRNAVRTPMQWSANRNAGFSDANPQRLYLPIIIDPEYHYESVNVETQLNNPNSLLWWHRRILGLRKRFRAMGRGRLSFFYPENHRVLAFVRRYEEERILVVANLSRYPQYVELDLSEFEGMVPVELTGQTRFPRIGELPYLLTLDPYACHWFSVESPEPPGEEERIPVLRVQADWTEAFAGRTRSRLEAALTSYVEHQRWFGGKARTIQSATLEEVVPVPYDGREARTAFLRVEYTEGEPETYLVPLAVRPAEEDEEEREDRHRVALVRTAEAEDPNVLYDACQDPELWHALFALVGDQGRLGGRRGKLRGWRSQAFDLLREGTEGPPSVRVLGVEQSNTSAALGNLFVLKLFRKLEPGVNPDLEMGRYLTEESPFDHIPRVAGALEYAAGREPVTVGILQEFVPNQGDAWAFTLDSLDRYFERVRAEPEETEAPATEPHPLDCLDREVPEPVRDLVGPYLESARLLGLRTAELHGALARETEDEAFRPERFTDHYRRALYHGILGRTNRALRFLQTRMEELPPPVRELARRVLDRQDLLREGLRRLRDRRVRGQRLRCHGDYHLGQVLWTGRDFVIIDFEGEPARHLSERRIKRSPLRDVAGMVRSFQYAPYAALLRMVEGGSLSAEDLPRLEPWARAWALWVTVVFLRAYFEEAQKHAFLPPSGEEVRTLLDAYLLEKAVYELEYEFNNRPSWVRIPLQGILDLTRGPA